MIKLYGIPNCNSVKKAKDYLTKKKIDFEFIDFKKNNPTKTQLKKWLQEVGADVLVDKKGTTWRTLAPEIKEAKMNQAQTIDLLFEKYAIIKRPVITKDDKIIVVGFDEEKYKTLF